MFKYYHKEVKDDSRSGRPSTSRTEVNVERVRQVMRGDVRLTVRMTTNQNMKKNIVWKIITEDLGMQKVCTKIVPRFGYAESLRKNGAKMCQNIIKRLHTELDLLRWIITGDETVGPKGKKPEQSPTTPRVKKARQSKSKALLIMLIDGRGIVHGEFFSQSQIISISKSTKRFCGMCTKINDSCCRTNCGCFTTTIRPLTTLWASGSFWSKEKSS